MRRQRTNPHTSTAARRCIATINLIPTQEALMDVSSLVRVAKHRTVHERAVQSQHEPPGVTLHRSEYRYLSRQAPWLPEEHLSTRCSCRDMLWLPRCALRPRAAWWAYRSP